jgi:hypothetical protein
MVKVWEEAYIPADEIVGYQCAWKDCEDCFKGDMPHGWVWLVTYWAPTPHIMTYPVPQKDMPRDAVLSLFDDSRVWGGVERLAKALYRRRYLSPRAVKQVLGDAFFADARMNRAFNSQPWQTNSGYSN